MGGTSPRVYASLCTLVGTPCPYIPALYMVHTLQHAAGMRGVDSSAQSVEEARVYREEKTLSHPENKPLSQQKQARKGEETRHRKHCCTRAPRNLYPPNN